MNAICTEHVFKLRLSLKSLTVVLFCIWILSSSIAHAQDSNSAQITSNQSGANQVDTNQVDTNQVDTNQVDTNQNNVTQTEVKEAQRTAPAVVSISSTIQGNQEQPKVLYIVPWKSAVDRRILYQTLNTRLESVFGHIERREHIRQVDLIEGLSKDEPHK